MTVTIHIPAILQLNASILADDKLMIITLASGSGNLYSLHGSGLVGPFDPISPIDLWLG